MEGEEDDLVELAANIVFEQIPEPVKEMSNPDEERKKLVDTANHVFGWLNWNHVIVNQTVDYIEFNKCMYSVGVSTHVRIELKSGAYHQEVGYGISEGLRSKMQAVSCAKEDSVLRGMRSALLSFGGEISEILLDPNNCIKKHKKHNHFQENGETTPEKKPLVQVFPNNKKSTPSATVKTAKKSNTAQLSPVLINSNDKNMSEEECRLERKRRQLQKQEEFRQQFKQQKLLQGSSNKNMPLKSIAGPAGKVNPAEWADVIETPLAEEEFLSTQEVERMVKTKNVSLLAVSADMKSPKEFSSVGSNAFVPKKQQLNNKRSL